MRQIRPDQFFVVSRQDRIFISRASSSQESTPVAESRKLAQMQASRLHYENAQANKLLKLSAVCPSGVRPWPCVTGLTAFAQVEIAMNLEHAQRPLNP